MASETNHPGESCWSINDIPYHALDRASVKDDALLLSIVATAAFVEITSDVYTRNLADFFSRRRRHC